jgi:triosephosphate isomerase
MRKPIIAGNWKMYNTVSEALALVNELKPLVAGAKNREIVIAPAFTALDAVGKAVSGSNVKLSGQDIYWEEKGAFTGQISPAMLKDVGCEYAIIGHSERRQFFGETDATVNKKIFAAVKFGLTPIICIGETLQEREKGQTFTVLGRQVREGLVNVTKDQIAKMVLAYEPVWAIGTGVTATKEQAEDAHVFIRKTISSMFGTAAADEVRILYGGSVKPENIAELMDQLNIDGALVGGASLKADSFAKIVNY